MFTQCGWVSLSNVKHKSSSKEMPLVKSKSTPETVDPVKPMFLVTSINLGSEIFTLQPFIQLTDIFWEKPTAHSAVSFTVIHVWISRRNLIGIQSCNLWQIQGLRTTEKRMLAKNSISANSVVNTVVRAAVQSLGKAPPLGVLCLRLGAITFLMPINSSQYFSL